MRPFGTFLFTTLTSVNCIPLLVKPNPENGDPTPVGIVTAVAELTNITLSKLVQLKNASSLIYSILLGIVNDPEAFPHPMNA